MGQSGSRSGQSKRGRRNDDGYERRNRGEKQIVTGGRGYRGDKAEG